jgi:alpha-L-fucosidase
MKVNSEGIHASRPWKIFGEGPTKLTGREQSAPRYTPEDIRFTAKAENLYAFLLAWPESRTATIKALAGNTPQIGGRKITDVSLLGYGGKLAWTQTAEGLKVTLPEQAPSEHAVTLRIKGLLA